MCQIPGRNAGYSHGFIEKPRGTIEFSPGRRPILTLAAQNHSTSRGLFFIAQRRAARNRIDMTIRLDRYSPMLRTELTVFKPSGWHFQSRSARMKFDFIFPWENSASRLQASRPDNQPAVETGSAVARTKQPHCHQSLRTAVSQIESGMLPIRNGTRDGLARDQLELFHGIPCPGP